MKFLAKAMLLSSTLTCSSAFAALYQAECSVPACVPFNTSNSYVVQFAVTTAQDNGAAIGDEITIYRQTSGRCQIVSINWHVIDVPVLNSSDLNYFESDCLS
jgi:hypothetical protein